MARKEQPGAAGAGAATPGGEPGFPGSHFYSAWAKRVRALVHSGLC